MVYQCETFLFLLFFVNDRNIAGASLEETKTENSGCHYDSPAEAGDQLNLGWRVPRTLYVTLSVSIHASTLRPDKEQLAPSLPHVSHSNWTIEISLNIEKNN